MSNNQTNQIKPLSEKDLKDKFLVTGKFYRHLGKEFRSKLLIDRKENDTNKEDKKQLLVVMLNPGSSSPGNENDYIKVSNLADIRKLEFVDAKPDKTQYQLMRLLLELKNQFSSILIINLFDVRESKSECLFKKINPDNENYNKDYTISIFDEERDLELTETFKKSKAVLLAWGKLPNRAIQKIVNKKKDLIETLSLKIGIEFHVVSLTENSENINHPLPPHYDKQKLWLEKATISIMSPSLS